MLLPNNTTDVYEYVLEALKLDLQYTPSRIRIDFEQTVVKAIESKVLTIVVDGCNFHWKKNIFSNVGDKGCLPLFHENEYFPILLDLVYRFCIVHTEEVVHTFESVVEPQHQDHLADREDQRVLYNGGGARSATYS